MYALNSALVMAVNLLTPALQVCVASALCAAISPSASRKRASLPANAVPAVPNSSAHAA